MRIAQVSAAQTAGGAERVAVDLHECYLQAGHEAVLLTPRPDDPQHLDGVIAIDPGAGRPAWQRALSRLDRRLARPVAAARRRRGYDDYDYPWTANLLDLLPWTPDVLHLHNLHGGWFDLRQLAPLSQRVPTVVTLHDASLLTGGPHVFCMQDRWGQGALRRNREHRNAVFADSKLLVATPSRWMNGHIAGSGLERGVAASRVIPNGIDLGVFRPAEDDGLRVKLKVEPSAVVVLGMGQSSRGRLSHGEPHLLRGEAAAWSSADRVLVLLDTPRRAWNTDRGAERCLPRLWFPGDLSRAFNMAEVFVHDVVEDNFPSVVIEAMACGTPVLAPRVGGIPEQFTDGAHGRLYGLDDTEQRRMILGEMLSDTAATRAMGKAAAEHARQHFDRRRMAADYLAFYGEIT